MSQPATTRAATIRLPILGQMRPVAADVPQGQAGVLDLLPGARSICHAAVDAAVEKAVGEGRSVACRPHCGACCRQLVPVSPVEALDLANLLEELPEPRRSVIRRRFVDAVRTLEMSGLLDAKEPRGRRGLALRTDLPRKEAYVDSARKYFALKIPCPFLDQESCGIYERRPLICREYLVTSDPKFCAEVDTVPVEGVDVPFHVTDALTRAAAKLTGAVEGTVPLVLALEWAETQREALQRPLDGQTMFVALLREVDEVLRATG